MKKFLKRIISSKNFWPIVIVTIVAVLAGRTLIFQSGYFNMHDDLQMMRQLEMEKCFLDGQIPCRWVPDMGYGFGFPLFNYYPPLPYLVGEIFRVFGMTFVNTAKILFALAFVASGITMYLLAKEFFGRFGGVLSSIFYIWAPYHSVDAYVRGAMNESWAFIWYPLIFWSSYRLVKDKKKNLIKWIIVLALAWFGLFTSHNLMVLIFTPFFGVWLLIHLWQEKRWNRIPQLIFSGIFSFLLAAFFTLPVLLEQKYVQVNTLVTGYYEYIAHFVTVNQLFISRFWGYGPSVWGTNDGLSFQIGYLHWILPLIVGALLAIRYWKTRKVDTFFLVGAFLFVMGWFSAFMTHSRSTFIWQHIGPLSFVQFPWRFLTMVVFSFSFLIGMLPGLLNKLKTKRGLLLNFIVNYFEFSLVAFLSIFVIVLNWNYFLPEHGHMGPLTDKEKFSAAAWELQQTAGIYDYLPDTAKQAPQAPRDVLAEVMAGMATISNPSDGTNWAKFDINVASPTATVRVGIFKYPNWTAFIDGQKTPTYVPDTENWGRMYLDIPSGMHKISLKLENTPIRTVANFISLISWIALLSFPLWRKRLLK